MEQINILTCGVVALFEFLFHKGYEKITKGTQSNDDFITNGHLLRALRIAMLKATSNLNNALVLELRKDLMFKEADNTEKEITDTNYLNIEGWIDKEIKIAESFDDEIDFKTPAFDKIHNLLIEANSDNEKDLIKNLSNKVKNDYLNKLVETKDIKNSITEKFKEYLMKGWNQIDDKNNSEDKDWFNITRQEFSNIISNKKYAIAKNKFHGRMLSQIATGIERIPIMENKIDKGFETIREKLDEHSKTLIEQTNNIITFLKKKENALSIFRLHCALAFLLFDEKNPGFLKLSNEEIRKMILKGLSSLDLFDKNEEFLIEIYTPEMINQKVILQTEKKYKELYSVALLAHSTTFRILYRGTVIEDNHASAMMELELSMKVEASKMGISDQEFWKWHKSMFIEDVNPQLVLKNLESLVSKVYSN